MEESGEKRQSSCHCGTAGARQDQLLFYRQDPADLYLDMKDIDKAFISQFKASLISGASLQKPGQGGGASCHGIRAGKRRPDYL